MEKLSYLKIILHTRIDLKVFFFEMIEIGVSGIILKPIVPKVFLVKFSTILEKININIERRKHIRVTPLPQDNAKIVIPTPKREVSGKITAITINGMAFEWEDPYSKNDFKEKEIIKNIRVNIKNMKIELDGITVRIEKSLVFIKFINLADYEMTVISSYIYEGMKLEIEKEAI